MQPNMAQVLNTLAHEIRTPLAVSQGYLKLYLDGRLTNVEDEGAVGVPGPQSGDVNGSSHEITIPLGV